MFSVAVVHSIELTNLSVNVLFAIYLEFMFRFRRPLVKNQTVIRLKLLPISLAQTEQV